MKMKYFMAAALALGLTAWSAAAQNDGPPGPPDQQGPPPGNNDGPPDGPPPGDGPGGKRHRPPPIIEALDANHDGVISTDEIANAAKALMTLDKKGDGKLTLEEVMGPRQGPPPGGPDGNQTGGPNGDQKPPRRPPGNNQDGPALIRAKDIVSLRYRLSSPHWTRTVTACSQRTKSPMPPSRCSSSTKTAMANSQ